MRASGLASKFVPRSALRAATELLTYTVAVSSSDRYMSSSYSYCRNKPTPAPTLPHAAAARTANAIAGTARIRITSNDIVQVSPLFSLAHVRQTHALLDRWQLADVPGVSCADPNGRRRSAP